MGKLLGIGAVVMGAVGVLLCLTAIGVGWWAAARITSRLNRVAARLDGGLAEAEKQLTRVETRVNAIRTDLNAVGAAAEKIADENPELPRVKAEIERLLDRLVPTFDRVDGLADSLDSGAAALRTAADILDQFKDDSQVTTGARTAADKIDRAADSLKGLRARVEDSKAVQAVQLTNEIIALTRQAIAGSELLAGGLTAAHQEIVVIRGRTIEIRDDLVFWIYGATAAGTLVWSWCCLGQLCLIGWGRRQFGGQAARG